jgi:hypothetical protein
MAARRRRQRQNLVLNVHGKGHFRVQGGGWTSELAWARIVYQPNKDEIQFIKVYKQRHKTKDLWAKPWFDDEQCDRFLG